MSDFILACGPGSGSMLENIFVLIAYLFSFLG